MEGSNKTLLEMKTLLSEFSATFYSKLSKTELEKFKKLQKAAESLHTEPSKRSKKIQFMEQIYFNPKSIIFCLNIKKLFTKKNFSFVRYSFALIRCLFKEAQRVDAKKEKFQQRVPKEPFSREVGTDPFVLKLEKIAEVKKDKKNLKVLQNLFNQVKDKRRRLKIYFNWKNNFKLIKARKEAFFKKFEKLARNLGRIVFGSLFRYKNWRRLSADILTRSLVPVIKSRKNRVFLMVFFRARFSQPILSNQNLPNLNEKDKKTLLEISENTSMGVTSNPSKTKNQENEESENTQDFGYSRKNNQKMTKKKKVLLCSGRAEAPKKIEKLEKNHSWVLAFALLKWKKNYFLVKSEVQNNKNALAVALEVFKGFKEKYHKRLCSILFENLKVKYLMSKQNKNFKTYLLFKMISGIITNKQKILLYKVFRAISSLRHKKVSFPALSIDMQGFHEMENSGDIMYKILKRIYQNSLLKKKVFAFISLQNFEPSSPVYIRKISVNHLADTLAKVIFFKKYLTFFEVKEKTFIIYRKCEFLMYSVSLALSNSTKRLLNFSIFMLKVNSLDGVHHLILNIQKAKRKELLRSSFNEIKEYAYDMENFIVARNLFTGSLVKKIYYKRVSSSILKWQSFAEDMKMAEELGLSNTLILAKNNNAYYEFSDKGFSDNESIGFNCGIEPLSIVNSLDSSFL